MKEILEIVISVLAVFGGYMLLDKLRVRLLYPRRIRSLVRAAVLFEDAESLALAASYARYLRLEREISDKRLIILVKDDIMKVEDDTLPWGDVYQFIKCKESKCDAKRSDTRE